MEKNKIPSEERLIGVLNKVVERSTRRMQVYIQQNPLMANAAVDFVFNSKVEFSIIHYCKQMLQAHYPGLTPAQAKNRNLRVVELAKSLQMRRCEARKLLEEVFFSDSLGFYKIVSQDGEFNLLSLNCHVKAVDKIYRNAQDVGITFSPIDFIDGEHSFYTEKEEKNRLVELLHSFCLTKQ